MKSHLSIIAILFALSSARAAHEEVLPSWNETPARKAIVDFVERITSESSADYVPPDERIAVFDNDGTLWAEQPVYFQVAFTIDRIKVMAQEHPEWKDTEPFKSVLEGRFKDVADAKNIASLMMAAHSGMTTEEFSRTVLDWINTARHPATGKPYTEMVYKPMIEVLEYLRANGFKTYIVSGGGVEFMRPWVSKAYGIPPEQVIGSRGKLKLEERNGKPVLLKLPEIDLIDDGPGKPVGIQQVIGRRPIAAFGNSDGDLNMLEWTAAGEGPRFCMLVHHTDAAREWAYDRNSKIGKLDRALDEANRKRWTVVDMKADWKSVFPDK
jgi:phosphoglycolate phosphatase-like HAD superfamily hydrolase